MNYQNNMTNPKQMETNMTKEEAIRREFYKFCDDNGFNPLRSECADWWLSLRQKELQELVKKAEEIVATEMDTKEFATILEFLACDDLAISIIKKLRSLLSTLTDETK